MSFFIRRLGALVALSIPLLGASTVSHALTFEEAVNLALSRAPQLKAKSADLAAADSLKRSAGQLPDPKLELGIENLPVSGPGQYSLTQDFMTMRKIGLMQEFPNKDKRTAQADDAQAQAAVATTQLQIEKLNVLRATAAAWIERDAAEKEIGLVASLREENRLFDAAVRARIASGKGSLADGLTPRQEAMAIDNLESDLLARRSKAITELERWIGKSAIDPLQGEVPDWPVDHAMLSHALHRHPELMLFDSRSSEIDAEIREAKAEKIPDWGVEVAYQQRAPQFGNMASFQFTIALPMFPESRQDPKIAAKIAEKEALDAERDATVREHNAMLESDMAEYRRLKDSLERQKKVLLPLADEKISLIRADWKSGKASLADLAAARRERIETELRAIELASSLSLASVRLHYAMLPGTAP
ncbi:MAG: TolC family protein [Burkholderiales bacterium]|nr:TolC family protein [Burkholderiales bacterium]